MWYIIIIPPERYINIYSTIVFLVVLIFFIVNSAARRAPPPPTVAAVKRVIHNIIIYNNNIISEKLRWARSQGQTRQRDARMHRHIYHYCNRRVIIKACRAKIVSGRVGGRGGRERFAPSHEVVNAHVIAVELYRTLLNVECVCMWVFVSRRFLFIFFVLQ